MAGIRSFLAIDIPHPIIKKIGSVLETLSSSPGDVKWVKPESIHITLKFFGNIEKKDIDRVGSRMESVAFLKNPFFLRIAGMGAFPNSRSPRVIWLGVEEKGDQLTTILRELEKNFTDMGFKPEKRPFNPHLTLGRIKSSRGRRDISQVLDNDADKDFGSFAVKSLVLFGSNLTPRGAIHTKLKTVDLPFKKNE